MPSREEPGLYRHETAGGYKETFVGAQYVSGRTTREIESLIAADLDEATRRGEFPVGVSCHVEVKGGPYTDTIKVLIRGVPDEFVDSDGARGLAAKVAAYAKAYNRIETSHSTSDQKKIQVEEEYHLVNTFPTTVTAAAIAMRQLQGFRVRWRDRLTTREDVTVSVTMSVFDKLADQDISGSTGRAEGDTDRT